MPGTLIFTDLDGTLLDAAHYSFAPAQPALELIRSRGIPLILCSSKIRAEMEVIRNKLDIRHPFITENGGGIFIPDGYFAGVPDSVAVDGYRMIALGTPYAEIRQQFVRLREQLGAQLAMQINELLVECKPTQAKASALFGIPLSWGNPPLLPRVARGAMQHKY